MKLHAIDIDLGNAVFHLVGLSQRGEVVVRKKFSRTQLLRFTANVQVDLIGMEAIHQMVNQIRGLLLERGITIRMGRCHLAAALPGILEDGSTSLSGTLRFLLVELKQELEQLAGHIEQAEALIQRAAQQSEACQRLDAIPGIGPLTATALIAAIGNGAAFRKGREFAAWVGLVPREHSTGGKQKLLGISKRGNSYLRKLFVQGARAVLRYRDKQCSGLKHWLAELSSRSHYNVVGVALANKLARMAWAVLASGEAYRPPVLDMTGVRRMAAV